MVPFQNLPHAFNRTLPKPVVFLVRKAARLRSDRRSSRDSRLVPSRRIQEINGRRWHVSPSVTRAIEGLSKLVCFPPAVNFKRYITDRGYIQTFKPCRSSTRGADSDPLTSFIEWRWLRMREILRKGPEYLTPLKANRTWHVSSGGIDESSGA